jgi:hypothetical protein
VSRDVSEASTERVRPYFSAVYAVAPTGAAAAVRYERLDFQYREQVVVASQRGLVIVRERVVSSGSVGGVFGTLQVLSPTYSVDWAEHPLEFRLELDRDLLREGGLGSPALPLGGIPLPAPDDAIQSMTDTTILDHFATQLIARLEIDILRALIGEERDDPAVEITPELVLDRTLEHWEYMGSSPEPTPESIVRQPLHGSLATSLAQLEVRE